jgi:mono/diheme cytochrome c family protein
MSKQNPHVESPHEPSGDDAIQPTAPDFIEMPEVPELSTDREPFPLWLYLVCGFALFLTGSSFTGFGIFGRDLIDAGPGGASVSTVATVAEAPPTPLEAGKKIYGNNCASCHDASGNGAPGKYPPLAGSEWVLGSKVRLAALLLKGLEGLVTVKGTSYSGNVMPAQEASLSPEKLADLMTYIRGTWGNTAGAVTPDEVNAAKTKCAAQTSAWNEAGLLAIAPHGPDPTDKK